MLIVLLANYKILLLVHRKMKIFRGDYVIVINIGIIHTNL